MGCIFADMVLGFFPFVDEDFLLSKEQFEEKVTDMFYFLDAYALELLLVTFVQFSRSLMSSKTYVLVVLFFRTCSSKIQPRGLQPMQHLIFPSLRMKHMATTWFKAT